MASIYKQPGSAAWWVSYYRGGRRVRESLKTCDERIARRKARRIEAELVTGDLEERTTTPLVPVLEAFCEHLTTTRTRKSYKNDISCLRTVFGPLCDALKPSSTVNHRHESKRPIAVLDQLAGRHVSVTTLEELTPGVIEAHLTQRVKRDGISAKTVNRVREVLHVMFNYAIRQHGFRASDRRYPNPVAAVRPRKLDERQIRFLSLAQIDEQLEVLADEPVLQTMVAVLIYAGLRREEVIWLTREDVDLEAGMIRVWKKTVNGETWRPKTRRNRRIPISSALLRYLNAYVPPGESPWYFPSKRGLRWDPDNFSHDLRAINRAHNLVWSCLDFRHTFGSQLAQKGESLFKIAELMGNSPEICRRHYAALIPEQMRDTVEFDPRPRLVVSSGDGASGAFDVA
jgi:integrase